MASNFEKVGEFFRKFDLEAYFEDEPAEIIDDEIFLFRLHLIMEETLEVVAAHRARDVLKLADGLADLLVVTYGLAHLCNIPIDAVFDMVHQANMRKERATGADDPRGKRSSGLDLVKPEGWTPPDLTGIVKSRWHDPAPYPLDTPGAEPRRSDREIALRAAVQKFLDGRMKHFHDSREVDDDLVKLAAALK